MIEINQMLIDGENRPMLNRKSESGEVIQYKDKDGNVKENPSKREMLYREAGNPKKGSVHKGKMGAVSIYEGDYGDNILIEIGGETVSISINSRYGEDIMKKLPAMYAIANENIEFAISPWRFNDTGNTGVSVKVGDEKVQDFFWDSELEGQPVYPGKEAKPAKKKKYFNDLNYFVREYVEENIINKDGLGENISPEKVDEMLNGKESDGDVKPEDLPF